MSPLGWKIRRRLLARGDAGCVRALVPGVELSGADVERLLDELRDSPTLWAALAGPGGDAWYPQVPLRDRVEAHLKLAGTGRGRSLFLYVLTRLTRPEVVVETGCFTGSDSALVLEALARNDRGFLHTIDLPARAGCFSQDGAPESSLPDGLEPGFLVADALRDRWELRPESVKDDLPELLAELDEVDLFFHDSHHSYTHVMWELASVWPHMAPGGLVVVDDISWNTAARDFARAVGARLVVHRSTPNVGAFRVGAPAHEERFAALEVAL